MAGPFFLPATLLTVGFCRVPCRVCATAIAEAAEVVPAALLGEGSDEAGPAADLPPPMPAPALSLSANGGMPPKKELVVWTRITELQLELYRAFLATDRVSQVSNWRRGRAPGLEPGEVGGGEEGAGLGTGRGRGLRRGRRA